ncbi:hypothetical protein M758_11G024500 [Ceratodon purpureus]|nr:hypothetical protein M758_11G024000 [Ceratodon purpureus]KAG0600325.1 hypothetical protein M758_11G024500 [Ceratodon purpureus]
MFPRTPTPTNIQVFIFHSTNPHSLNRTHSSTDPKSENPQPAFAQKRGSHTTHNPISRIPNSRQNPPTQLERELTPEQVRELETSASGVIFPRVRGGGLPEELRSGLATATTARAKA